MGLLSACKNLIIKGLVKMKVFVVKDSTGRTSEMLADSRSELCETLNSMGNKGYTIESEKIFSYLGDGSINPMNTETISGGNTVNYPGVTPDTPSNIVEYPGGYINKQQESKITERRISISPESTAVLPIYFNDNGNQFKIENGKVYKKVWTTIVSDDFRIAISQNWSGDHDEKIPEKYCIERLDWQLIQSN